MTYDTSRQGGSGNKTRNKTEMPDMGDTLNQARNQAGDIASNALDRAGDIASDVRDSAQRGLNQASRSLGLGDNIGDQPWLLLGAGVAFGYLLGNLWGNSSSGQQYQPQNNWNPQSYASYGSGYGQSTHERAMQQAQQYESAQREGMVGKLGRKFFSSLNSLEDLFKDQLQDIYDAEHQILKALPKMIQAATSHELKQAFETHLQQTQNQVRRLEQVFQQFGMDPMGKTCYAMQGLVAEGEELMAMRADPQVMDAGLIAAAQRVEHYEMAGYGCLRTWARQLGHEQAVQLLQQTLSEEEQTDRNLSQIAERNINTKAVGR